MDEKNTGLLSSLSDLNDDQIDLEAESLLRGNDTINRSSKGKRRISWWIPIHLGLIVIYSGLFFWYTRYYAIEQACTPIIYSPANPELSRELRLVDGFEEGSIYAGQPSPESDAAWSALLYNINIRISDDELKRLNKTSVKLVDGGYLGTLGVYHELHCIKRLRKLFHKEYYYPNITQEEETELIIHIGHCVELLRQSAMCRGDTTIAPFEFRGDNPQPFVVNGNYHDCAKWEPLENFAKARRVDLWNLSNLVHPGLKTTTLPTIEADHASLQSS